MTSPIMQSAAVAISQSINNMQATGQTSLTATSMAATPQGKNEVDKTQTRRSSTLGNTGKNQSIVYGPNKKQVESAFSAQGMKAVEKDEQRDSTREEEEKEGKILDETA